MSKYKDVGRAILTRVADYTSTSASVTTAFSAQTYIIRIAATSPIHYHVYDAIVSSVATSADPLLPANVFEIVAVSPGQCVSVVRAASAVGSADGRVTVTELA